MINGVDCTNKNISIPVSILIIISVVSFISGIILGIAITPISKNFVVKTSKKDNFNADEYVRSLNFDKN